jgi:CheY-like chemotaxis protein/uncharacterized coiled-coil protein SlyX
MADCREASLLGRIADIVHARYEQRDFYGPDVSALDVAQLHSEARPSIRQSRNPHVFLLMRNKFRCAACAVLLKNFGCTVTICFNGREAYVKHLRRHADRFDIALVEWDLPDVAGRDLVSYCRGEGAKLCFVALLSTSVLPGTAVRGGANLFLRMPLPIHLHVIRKLLLPSEITATGFPTHVLVSKARYHEVAHVLGGVRLHADETVEMLLNEVTAQLVDEEEGEEDAAVVENIVDNLRRVLAKAGKVTTASDRQIGRLQDVVRRVLRIAKDSRVAVHRAMDEARSLRSQLRECNALHNYVPINDSSTVEELDKMLKSELKARVAKLEKQQLVLFSDIDRLNSDMAALASTNFRLEEALGVLQDGDMASMNEGDDDAAASIRPVVSFLRPLKSPTVGSPRDSVTTSLPFRSRLMSTNQVLKASLNRRNRAAAVKRRSPHEVVESLETMLMQREDMLLTTQRVSCEPVAVSITWDASRSVELQSVYEPVARVLGEGVDLLNTLCARLLATFPRCRPRLAEFAFEFGKRFAAVQPANVFSMQRLGTSPPQAQLSRIGSVVLGDSNQSSPLAGTLKNASVAILEVRSKLAATHGRLARNLLLATISCHMRRCYFTWKLFRVMRRGFVSNAEEERLARKTRQAPTTRAEKELAEQRAAHFEAKGRIAALEKQLAFANASVAELHAQAAAAWVPPPLPDTAQNFVDRLDAKMQTDPVNIAPDGFRWQAPSRPAAKEPDVSSEAPNTSTAVLTVDVPQHAALRVAGETEVKGAKGRKASRRSISGPGGDTARSSEPPKPAKGRLPRAPSSPAVLEAKLQRSEAKVVELEDNIAVLEGELERLSTALVKATAKAANEADRQAMEQSTAEIVVQIPAASADTPPPSARTPAVATAECVLQRSPAADVAVNPFLHARRFTLEQQAPDDDPPPLREITALSALLMSATPRGQPLSPSHPDFPSLIRPVTGRQLQSNENAQRSRPPLRQRMDAALPPAPVHAPALRGSEGLVGLTGVPLTSHGDPHGRKSVSVSPAATPAGPRSRVVSPLPQLGVRDAQAPHDVNARQNLQNLLVAHSARGKPTPTSEVAALPPLTARSHDTAVRTSTQKAEDAKKLFAKLGIGQMPRQKMKPAPDNLSVVARNK